MELARHPRGQEEHRAEWTATLHQSSSGPCRQGDDRASIGTVGDSYDNALAENLWSTIKIELVYWPETTFATRTEAEHALLRYIDGWYNPRRIQAGLNGLSPDEYEQAHNRTHHR